MPVLGESSTNSHAPRIRRPPCTTSRLSLTVRHSALSNRPVTSTIPGSLPSRPVVGCQPTPQPGSRRGSQSAHRILSCYPTLHVCDPASYAPPLHALLSPPPAGCFQRVITRPSNRPGRYLPPVVGCDPFLSLEAAGVRASIALLLATRPSIPPAIPLPDWDQVKPPEPPPAARDASRSHGPANRTGGRPRTRWGPSGLPSYNLSSRQQTLYASSRSGGEATADLTSTRTMTNPQRKTPRQSPTTGDHVRSDGAHELRRACPRKSAPRSVWRLSSTYPRRPQACICWRKVCPAQLCFY